MNAGLVFDDLYWNLVNEHVVVDKDVRRNIVIIGGGVIGLSTALACKASFPNSRITVVAKDFESTTSSVSAGVWFPCMVEDSLGQDFAKSTYLSMLAYSKKVEQLPGAGCQNLAACWREKKEKGAKENPIITTDGTTMSLDANEDFDKHVPLYVENRKKSQSVSPGFKSGLEWTTVIVQSQLMLPLMRRLCVHQRIIFKRQEVKAAEAFLKSLDRGTIVINCAGLGAGDIVGGDDALHPVQGSVVKIVPVPELTGGRFLDALGEEEEMAYIIPRSDCYVLGGTALKNVYSVAPPDASVVAGILSRCEQLAPGLSRAARPIVVATGLRPVRTGGLAVGRRSDAWIDNYGFGGSGWTMFFGASLYAARLAHQICAGAPKL